MATKFTREPQHAHPDAEAPFRRRVEGGPHPAPSFQGRRRLILFLAAVSILAVLMAGRMMLKASTGAVSSPVREETGPLQSGDGVVFDKPPAPTYPKDPYLLGIQVQAEGGKTLRQVIVVERALWEAVRVGGRVRVQYRVDQSVDRLDVRRVDLP